MDLEAQLRGSISGDFDYFGVADLRPARTAIMEQGGLDVDNYPIAISIGVILIDDIVDLLPNGKERWAAVTYRSHSYDVINTRLDQMASRVASVLQREGFRALPLPASQRVSDETISGLFSHKMAAHLAGLGWIGKSCLLVTPDHGPRVRWTSVLTDAPLTPSGPAMAQRCEGCMECVEACPVGAILGRNFQVDEPREVRMDARRCEGHFDRMEEEGRLAVCGMCLYVCPHGRRSRR